MAPYPILFRALKTIIMPNFMLLTESDQLKHISALLTGRRLTSNNRAACQRFIGRTRIAERRFLTGLQGGYFS